MTRTGGALQYRCRCGRCPKTAKCCLYALCTVCARRVILEDRAKGGGHVRVPK